MRKRLNNTQAALIVIWGIFVMAPTCKMKFAPLARRVCSSSGDIPSTTEGECCISSCVYSHCLSDSARTASVSLDGSLDRGVRRRAGDGTRLAGIMESVKVRVKAWSGLLEAADTWIFSVARIQMKSKATRAQRRNQGGED
jgi:hypothetical protein